MKNPVLNSMNCLWLVSKYSTCNMWYHKWYVIFSRHDLYNCSMHVMKRIILSLHKTKHERRLIYLMSGKRAIIQDIQFIKGSDSKMNINICLFSFIIIDTQQQISCDHNLHVCVFHSKCNTYLHVEARENTLSYRINAVSYY